MLVIKMATVMMTLTSLIATMMVEIVVWDLTSILNIALNVNVFLKKERVFFMKFTWFFACTISVYRVVEFWNVFFFMLLFLNCGYEICFGTMSNLSCPNFVARKMQIFSATLWNPKILSSGNEELKSWGSSRNRVRISNHRHLNLSF